MKGIELTQGYVTLVDNEDYEWLTENSWHVVTKGKKTFRHYARGTRWVPGEPHPKTGEFYYHKEKDGTLHKRNGHYRVVTMHRLIMNAPDGVDVDHIDGNGLNNQRLNLRLCSRSENNMNSKLRCTSKSGVKGVSWDAQTKKWRATITLNGKMKNLGRFEDRNDALNARLEAEKELFGEHSRARF
jgi:hypothetical protein